MNLRLFDYRSVYGFYEVSIKLGRDKYVIIDIFYVKFIKWCFDKLYVYVILGGFVLKKLCRLIIYWLLYEMIFLDFYIVIMISFVYI